MGVPPGLISRPGDGYLQRNNVFLFRRGRRSIYLLFPGEIHILEGLEKTARS